MEKKRQDELKTLLKTNDQLDDLNGSENSVSVSLTSSNSEEVDSVDEPIINKLLLTKISESFEGPESNNQASRVGA